MICITYYDLNPAIANITTTSRILQLFFVILLHSLDFLFVLVFCCKLHASATYPVCTTTLPNANNELKTRKVILARYWRHSDNCTEWASYFFPLFSQPILAWITIVRSYSGGDHKEFIWLLQKFDILIPEGPYWRKRKWGERAKQNWTFYFSPFFTHCRAWSQAKHLWVL